MSNRSKGNRREREYELMEIAKGRIVYRVKGSIRFNENVDIFHMFDMLSVDPKNKTKIWIQVKSNKKISKKEKEKWRKFKEKYFTNKDIMVWATKIDYKGWWQ